MLQKGQRLQVFAGDAIIAELSRPLFVATSPNTSLLANNHVQLSYDIDRDGVVALAIERKGL
jgi:hypothetical protein